MTINPDLLNGLLEFVGSLTIWANVKKLSQDKEVKGSHWEMMIFFAVWAAFNLFYYPHLQQMWSLAGATSMFAAEWVWVGLAWFYASGKRKKEAFGRLLMENQAMGGGFVEESYDRRKQRFEEQLKVDALCQAERRAKKNPYSPEAILLLQRKFGGANAEV